jgi:hypothetical protein
MAIQGGPDIVEDGLVLHLDAAEPLCFRGEPTTNLSPYTNGTVNRGSWPYGAYTHSIETTGEFVGWEKIVATSVGSATSNLIMNMGQFFPTSGVQYTGSIEFYSPYNNLRFEITGGQGIGSATRIGSSNKYYRTFATSISTNMAWYLRTIASTPANTAITNGVIYYRRAQFEQKPYYTDFTIGTRGSTVATGGGLLDLTNNGNNGTINRAASPSAAFYNGDNKGSLVFNGVDDYVTVGTSPNSMNFSSGSTISVWVKVLSNTSGLFADNTVLSKWWDGSVRGFNITASSNSASIVYRPSNSGGDISLAYTPGASFFSNWNFLSFVNSSLRIDMYSNGLLVDFLERNDTFIRNNSADLRVGRYTHTSLNGYSNSQVSNVSIYNKALTASEIQQNFNATKGRFGL